MDLIEHKWLKAALEDFHLAMELASSGTPASRRHTVLLLEEVAEFLFYQKLDHIRADIYRTGRDTIGLDRAIERLEDNGVRIPFIGAVRSIQKPRGDAKHHAQVPSVDDFNFAVPRFRIFISLFLFENFWHELEDRIFQIKIMPYHEALFQYFRLSEKHRPEIAVRDVAAAVIHQARFALGITSPIETWKSDDLSYLVSLLDSDTMPRCVARMPEKRRESLYQSVNEVKSNVADIARLARAYTELFCLLDEMLPSMFDIDKATMLTQRICVPESHRFEKSIAWQRYDGQELKELEELLLRYPQARPLLGRERESFPWYGDDSYFDGPEPPPDYYRYHLLAVFDGDRWRPIRLEAQFYAESIEIGSDEFIVMESIDRTTAVQCSLWLEGSRDGWPAKSSEQRRIVKSVIREFVSLVEASFAQ